MKRIGGYVLAAVVGAAAVYLWFPRPETSGVLTEKLATCERNLKAEQGANDSMAKRLNDADHDCQAKCDARVDQMLAERKP